MGSRAPCQTPTDPPGPSGPLSTVSSSYSDPPRAAQSPSYSTTDTAAVAVAVVALSFLSRLCAHPSLLRPLSLRSPSTVVRVETPRVLFPIVLPPSPSRLFALASLFSLFLSLFFRCPDSRTTRAFSFFSSFFFFLSLSPSSFAYILPLHPITVSLSILLVFLLSYLRCH